MSARRVVSLLVCAVVGLGVPALGSSAGALDPGGTGVVTTAPRPAPGTWRVDRVAADSYRLVWRAPRRLPLTSDRPVVTLDGRVLGAPSLGRDGRTLSLVVRSADRPDPARLDVVLSGDRLDVAGHDRASATGGAVAALDTTPLPDDPATPGPFAVVTSDYDLTPVKLAGMPEPIEMVGHVVEPAPDAVTGPRPLVLFLHGRHEVCYAPGTGDVGGRWPCRGRWEEIPSQLGYDYIQQVLASQGYATVSIRVNGINAQDWALRDGGADARAAIVQRHLDHWVDLAVDHQVDLSRVVLVGHSRGGEGVDRASIQIPLSAPYRVVGQVLLAPTNFGTQTAPYVPTVTVLPYCDGDVSDLQGQRFTDSARDLARDDTSLKSSVIALGANHNFFNTEWTPGIAAAPAWDDWFGTRGVCGSSSPTRLTAEEQQKVGIAYVAGAVRLFADDAQEFLPMYDGSPVSVTSVGDADVRSAAIGGGAELRKPALATGRTLPVGAVSRFCNGVVKPGAPVSVCGREAGLSSWLTPHWPDAGELVQSRQELELSWSDVGQSGGLLFDDPLDLTGRRLALRAIVDRVVGDAGLRVRVTDATGASAELDPEGGTTLPTLPKGRGLTKRLAQALVVDPSGAAGVDLTAITAVDLVSVSGAGRVWLLDVGSWPSALAPVPEKRLPLVEMKRVKIQEGDGPGMVEAEVPFTIVGDLTSRASFTAGVVSFDPRVKPFRLPIDLAPGQTSGSVTITYTANKLDDFPRRAVDVFASPAYGVMTDRYLGGALILDDDPTPTITVRPVDRTITEGEDAAWRIHLSRGLGYDSWLFGMVVARPGQGRPLAASDVPRRWLERHAGEPPSPDTPLHVMKAFVDHQLKSGRTTVDLVLPTRADGVREGRESVSLKLWLPNRQRVVKTIVVRD